MPDSSLFATVLASTVHDMKNSLSMLLSRLDQISDQVAQDEANRQSVSDLRYQANRINVSLMELLTLYKLEKQQLSVNITEVFVADFLEDCIAAHTQLAASKGIRLDLQCDDELIWFFDADLVGITVNNIIGNCMRYTESRVSVSARVDNRQLVLRIDDDGPGYPDSMLADPETLGRQVNFNTGSTGLGLFFAATIAQQHRRHGKQGSIHLENNGALDGGGFQITLP